MTTDRLQRRIGEFLDQADQALDKEDWETVASLARRILAMDPDNQDAAGYLATAERGRSAGRPASPSPPAPEPGAGSPQPATFANNRYTVKRFLGEGGKKRVYLAHDTTLARDVAFALIKTDGLDVEGRERITREAQAMGKLGTHPHVVSVFDMGSEGESPYLVTELMQGGDIEGLLEQAPEHRLAIPDAVSLAVQVCRGLEFAHSHGLVHRDLKPGNVWLTADGTAKIGDFGLAVSLDRSRLTRAGMMVGTVSYMPPEQAMGGEVSPRSDLYSLGAMLYEMVTGRPPFVGEESVAIITQHLNVPPVSPTWHRPECPPGLEALILRLLEKDAAKRPASAGEVRQALEGLGSPAGESQAGRASTDTTPAAPANDNPLYRRTFVGREQELRQLQATFDGAVSGNGALVMVVGEPGIGKTALCEQLATYVTVRGGRALVGHCYEEGSLTLPYLPFVEAVRSYVLDAAPEKLRDELGSGATDVARIVSEVREKVAVEPRESGDPEDDRWRLYQSLTGFLRNASTVQPLLLILEDLHWADRGTLDFLVHISRNLQGARVLLIGTYRDVEVDRTHPLSGTIAELRRAANFGRVPLRGLTVDEVHRMMCQLRGQDVPWSRAEAIHRQTEGNPLFIQEVLRYLVEEGLVVRDGGRWVRADDGAPDSGIPEGLRDVIGKRLSRLSAECNRLLTMAAVIGREFDLTTLQRVAEIPEESLLSSLEEALRVGVLEERAQGNAVRYRFTHAFFQQTLYEEIIAPRRIRLHQQVARALEGIYSRRLEEHAAELAEHYAYSSDPADLEKAVRYGEMAAARATAVFAYAEAVRALERCLQVQEVLDPDDRRKHCALLVTLAGVLLPAGEPQRAANEVAEEALGLAETLLATRPADPEARAWASTACRTALDALHRYGGAGSYLTPAWDRWVAAALRHSLPNSVDRVYADVCDYLWSAREFNPLNAWSRLSDSLELARRLGDPEALHFVASQYLNVGHPAYQEERLRVSREVVTWPRQGVSAYHLGRVLYFSGNALLSSGYREEAEAHWKELREIAGRARDVALRMRPPFLDVVMATIDGRFEEAVEACQRFEEQCAEVGSPGYALQWRGALGFRALLHLGRPEEALEHLARSTESFGLRPSLRVVCLAQAGRVEEAASGLATALASLPESLDGIVIAETTVRLLEAAVALPDREACRRLLPYVTPMAGTLGNGERGITCVDRHLGAAAALLGDGAAALGHYQQGLQLCRQVRFRPEVALFRLQLAELALEGSPQEQQEAVEHLDFAIAEFREMKMQPALERALGHKGLLHA